MIVGKAACVFHASCTPDKNSLCLGRWGLLVCRLEARKRFLLQGIQTGSGVQPHFHSICLCTEAFPAKAKRTGSEANHSPVCSAESNKAWSYDSPYPHAFMACIWSTFLTAVLFTGSAANNREPCVYVFSSLHFSFSPIYVTLSFYVLLQLRDS